MDASFRKVVGPNLIFYKYTKKLQERFKLAGVYIHIPFCRKLCSYCDFHFSVSPERMPEMLDALRRELIQRRDYLNEPVKTLYFGGGTPSVYAPQELGLLIDTVKELFGVGQFDELTVEANPDDLTDRYLEGLAEAGVNRLSIGVQSFQDSHLAFFNRRHDGRQAFDSVQRARKHGFDNITLDLIYGIPAMTEVEWAYNLDRFLALNIQHLSAYHLTIEERTVFGKMAKRGDLKPVADEVSTKHYEILERFMREAGYLHYEVSNFARPGYEALHNGNYWSGVPYLGIGPSAHSYDGTIRQWNVRSNKLYLERIDNGDYFETEILSDTDRYNEYIMTSLRTSRGIDREEVARRFGAQKLFCLDRDIVPFTSRGQIACDGRRLYIPSEYYLLSDYIISELFCV